MTKKIAIIDDEPSFCNLLAETIENQGDYTVKTYTCSIEALADLPNLKPDAVFVDMLMPEKDGGSVIKSIRDQISPAPPIVMVTGMIAEDEVSNLNFPILAKPVNKKSLERILQNLSS